MYKRVSGILLALLMFYSFARSQSTAVISGVVSDSINQPIENFKILVTGQSPQPVNNKKGYYEITVPANKNIQVVYSCLGFYSDTLNVFLSAGDRKVYNKVLYLKTESFGGVVISSTSISSFVKIDKRNVFVLPTANNGVEALIKTQIGVTSNNELSSQYNVRGGNYDENLVYVNDIEIYRPLLVRSGQQEGLSFINPDLVESIQFSAGGFDAKYGDKMSSVLDIKYKKPTDKKIAGSVSGSLLGFTTHLEGMTNNTKLTYMIGIRQKSNSYLLKSLQTKGDYKPSFTDLQTCLNYFINEKLNIDFLGNYSRNVYNVIPQTRQTDFGTLNDAIRLTIYFDGQEVDRFDSYFGAFSANYSPKKNMLLKFITSAYRTNESETFDTQGQYWLDQLETNMGDQTFGSVAYNMGVGTFLNHARNYLNATVLNAEHKGTYITSKAVHYWGARYQREYIDDRLNEWQMLDSAGYSQPYIHDSIGYTIPGIQPYHELLMQDVVKTQNILSSNRYSGYYEQKRVFDNDSSTFEFSGGVRTNYWDLNHQLIVSPRASISYKPKWKHNFLFRFSTGYYSQPPFYRELRDLDGNINKNVKAQTSIHFVLGSQYDFKAWGRPFRYVTEVYYKILDNLVPYEVDNVRLRYYAKNNARGFSTGIDMKINGEFVKGIESWASMSVMEIMEDIKDDFYYTYLNKSGEQIIPGYTADQVKFDSIRHEPGYIPRPTDQRLNFSLFFQDFLPKNPSYKMHLNLVFGTGLPFGPPGRDRYKDTLRMPTYRRVDIGFSKQIISEDSKLKPKNPFRHFKSIWVTLEVFNLLQVNNTISYIWVTDVNSRQYAVPNFLTPRQLNVRLIAQF